MIITHEHPSWITDHMVAIYDQDQGEAEGMEHDELIARAVTTNTEIAALEAETRCVDMAREVINLEGWAQMLDERIREMTARKARIAKSADRVKQFAKETMIQHQIKNIKADDLTMFTSERKGGIQIVDETALPIVFTKSQVVPDKVKINAHFKETGEMIRGCDMGDAKTNLTIKRK